MSSRMRVLRWLPACLLVALAALIALSPTLARTASDASFSDTQSAGSNTVTAGACAATTTWQNLVNNSFTGTAREVWQTTNTTTTALPNDTWNSDNWSENSLVTNQAGALYCSSDTAIAADLTTDVGSSPLKSYGTWGANSTTTLLLWMKGTSATAGRLVSLAESASGGSSYAERVLWVTASGGLAFGGRYGSNTTQTWTTSTSGVTVSDGRWHLVVVVMTNTATSNTAPVIYVDGTAAATTTTGTVTYRGRASSTTNAAWYLGSNTAGRSPVGAPTAAYLAAYDEFVVVSTTPSATLLGAGAGSLFAAGDS
jgi:hypothetical protein